MDFVAIEVSRKLAFHHPLVTHMLKDFEDADLSIHQSWQCVIHALSVSQSIFSN